MRRKIERIRVIVREHLDDDPFEKMIAKSQGTVQKGSTVGVKISAGGELYGGYMCFTQPILSASDVAEAVNDLFESALKEMLEGDDG
jgi:hypothetical protein